MCDYINTHTVQKNSSKIQHPPLVFVCVFDDDNIVVNLSNKIKAKKIYFFLVINTNTHTHIDRTQL